MKLGSLSTLLALSLSSALLSPSLTQSSFSLSSGYSSKLNSKVHIHEKPGQSILTLRLTLCSISSHTFFSLLLSREALGALLHSYLSLCEVVVFLFHRSPAKDYNGKTSRWP
ncbi:hypothetical protein L3X38_007783 [Prunus dulcis]|uniref:Secreted protein n=1 Tax=Prunus dulcis TaxID=3755 RepID=A0AAD5F6G9_PRUDU|nr:hypothetical protein L3X38_007783 [Prunus dulcis]